MLQTHILGSETAGTFGGKWVRAEFLAEKNLSENGGEEFDWAFQVHFRAFQAVFPMARTYAAHPPTEQKAFFIIKLEEATFARLSHITRKPNLAR
jgi:hypothetical protein